ncbi:MAG: hypothetical protein RIE53_13475 [Rhodothermales bacterium]
MTVAIDAAMAVLIWLVQLIIYPSFRTQEQNGFRRWHRRYTRTMGIIVGPLMAAQIFLHGSDLWTGVTVISMAQAVCIAIALVGTVTLSVPCHHALSSRGKDSGIIDRLVRTNWLRTAAWTGVLVLSLAG